MRTVYLDNGSATKIDPEVLEAMLPYLKDEYGNAQSMHSLGQKAKDALENSRAAVAGLINAPTSQIIFTSCGSESNNLAIKGVAYAYRDRGKHIIVSSIEHFSVLQAAKRLNQEGYEITYLPVDKYGVVSPDELEKNIRKDTILVSIQHANPEIGTIQDIKKLSEIVHKAGAFLHTDAVASAGIIPIDVNELGVDLLSFAGSTIYGPKGAGALFFKKGLRLVPLFDGGIQESGRRAGTENIPAIVGFGKACEIAKEELRTNAEKMAGLQKRLINELSQRIQYIYLNGHPENRLPNNVNFSVEFVEGEGMLLFLDQKGIYVTSGSACTSRALKMSHVLQAIKIDPAVAQGSVLMVLSKYNTDEDIDYILNEFPPIVTQLRNMSPLYAYFLKTGKRMEAGPGTDYEHHHDDENS
uniref:Cysteine desulfurase n=1 Tax=candidate division WOR-3 bacterium TaxID=2052148 RepID=A0A7V0Z3S1_UNCW3